MIEEELTENLEEENEGEEPAQEELEGFYNDVVVTTVVDSSPSPWSTVLIGMAMLLIGLVGGYFGRPLLVPDPTPQVVEVVKEVPSTQAAPTGDTVSAEEREAMMAELMTIVVGETRHFYGNPDAPVTLIEFSDFR